MKICQLCRINPAIRNSHIVPTLVGKSIKNHSPTGYLRQDTNPNKRLQDSDKYPLLCHKCEQTFGEREKKFNDYIFKDFQELGKVNFGYEAWLHYL